MSNVKLIRGLGLIGLIASVFNCTVGGGIFRLPASVFQIVGANSPLVYLLCFLVMLLVATVFIQVGSEVSVSGGPYAYVQPVLGKFAAYTCGVLLWLLATFAFASVANAYASFLGVLIPEFSSPLAQALSLGVTLSLLALFNIKGVKSGSRVSVILSVVKLLPLLLLIAVGAPRIQFHALWSEGPIEWRGISRGAMMLIFAFTGVESALIPSGEIANPKRNLSRALYAALFLVLFLYLGVQSVSQSVLGSELGVPGVSPLALTAERLMGSTGKWILMLGAVVSTAGYLSAITLSLPRSLFAFAEDGYLPKWFSKVEPVHHTPSRAIWAQSGIAWLLAVSSQFEKLAILANLSAILMYVLCAIAAIQLHRTQMMVGRNDVRKIIPWLALIPMAFLLTSVTLAEWLSVGGVLVVSIVLYRFRRTEPG